MTLYEMLTGTIPSWSDEHSDPAAVGAEAVIEADRFDPHLRDGLTGFFTKALRSDARERFDNAEDMQRAWRHVFDQPALEKIEDAGFDAVARRTTAQTSISELGYGIEAQDVLDRVGIHTVRDLLAVHRRTLRYLTGVGDRICREIREKAKRLAQLRPDLVPGAPAPSEPGTAPAGVPTVDRLAEVLIPRRALGDETAEDRALAVFLGLEATDPPREWPTIGQVGSHCGMARTAVVTALAKGRERWHKQPLLTALREDIRALLNAHGAVITATELACQVLAMRGSAMAAEDERLRLAGAVVRAAADAEGALVDPRFQLFEDDAAPLVADSLELAIHAHALGREADALARQDPPLAPQRAMEEFERLGLAGGLHPGQARPAADAGRRDVARCRAVEPPGDLSARHAAGTSIAAGAGFPARPPHADRGSATRAHALALPGGGPAAAPAGAGRPASGGRRRAGLAGRRPGTRLLRRPGGAWDVHRRQFASSPHDRGTGGRSDAGSRRGAAA
ncbi:hypothetical protein [Skermanella stibiiresistens]|uniref:hypothetical protein n=1 Tax=Skermanella stibiiresistens TaxID=913326 RepID=UPI0004BA91A5|nr:hypothetical protein [Skermanella stibiiresistens]